MPISNHTRRFIQRGAFVLLGLILAVWMGVRETSCERDPPILWNDQSISSCDCYSESYTEARTKFRTAVSNHKNATLYTFPVVNDLLTMDIAIIPGTLAGRTVIHTSGYHGVEGFAGSVIQIAWLGLSQQQQQEEMPTVILVHAVNPFGFATFRRTNEKNVDLNRNGLHPNEWQTALTRNNADDFDETLLNPRRAPTKWDLFVNIYWVAAKALFKHGLLTLKRAMVTGQYTDDTKIFYGGRELQPSLDILFNFLQEHVPQDATVTMVNVHTGLGPSGQDTILTSANSGISPRDLKAVFGGSNIPSLTQSANDVSDGYEMVIGTAEDYFSHLFKKANDWIVTQEFGTVSSISVGSSLILENMARQYLPEQDAITWTILLKRAFYKQTTKWRHDVMVRGLRVLHQAMDRTASV